ncbi:MAG TPA: translation initiation factor IF-1 [Candidatus Absconditabacterales bacterium]|nr:translation initiation factor IF-1 [Candidatus Absconditabacterales bacterium]HRU49875.1 translation initiation factor IF-1 [Candidatus Absconditabacterales bacterium]
MVKQAALEWDGEVLEKLPAGVLKVKLKDVGAEIRCKLSGKMKQKHISVIPGDWVKVEVNQYDMTQGRIIYRYNNYDPNQDNDGIVYEGNIDEGDID